VVGVVVSISSLRVIDDSTIFTTIPYESVFSLAKQAASRLGGKVKSEDLDAGVLQYRFRYGINPTGIRVDIQFRRSPDGSTEAVVKGRIGDSFDTTGAGKARGREVLNEMVRQIESGSTAPALASSLNPTPVNAPIIGESGSTHRGKSKTTATLLAFFLGGIGIHRFYLGSWGFGLVYVGLSLLGVGIGFPIGVLLGLYDGVRFFFMKNQNFEAKFNYSKVRAFSF
jgi:TM2 domain-containing membrane protein YozV